MSKTKFELLKVIPRYKKNGKTKKTVELKTIGKYTNIADVYSAMSLILEKEPSVILQIEKTFLNGAFE